MATRFYINRTAPAPQVTPPAVTNIWDHPFLGGLATPETYRMSTSKISSAFSTRAFTYDSADDASNDYDSLGLVLVSPPLAAQSITNTQRVKAQIRALEANTLNNQVMSLRVYLMDQTGTLVGDLLPQTRTAVEFATTFTNRVFNVLMPGTGPSSCSAYDRIVVEIGGGGRPTSGAGVNGHNFSFDVGDSAGSDLPEDDSTTTQLNPWVNFPDTFTFLADDVFVQNQTDNALPHYGEPEAVAY